MKSIIVCTTKSTKKLCNERAGCGKDMDKNPIKFLKRAVKPFAMFNIYN